MAADQGKGSGPSRYLCPFPGCNRSFRDFWRLKVHYRAAPDARGSGIERGHGEELPFCPLCNTDLKKVRYHKCSALPTPVTARSPGPASQAGQAQQQPRSAALTRRQSVGIGPPPGARGPSAGPRGPGAPWGVDQVQPGFAPAAPAGPIAVKGRVLPQQQQQHQLVPSVVPTTAAEHIVHQFRQQLANLRAGAAGSPQQQQQQQVAIKPSASGDASPVLHQPLPAPNRPLPEQQQALGPQALPQKRPLADPGPMPAAGSPAEYQQPPPSQLPPAAEEDQGLLPYPLQQLADAGPAAKRRRSSACGTAGGSHQQQQQQQQEPVSADGLLFEPSSVPQQLSGDVASLQQQQAVALVPMASGPAPSAPAAGAGAAAAAGTASPQGSSGSSSRQGGPLSSDTPPPTDVLEGLLDLGADAAAAAAAAAAQQGWSFRDCTFRGQPESAAAGGGGGGGGSGAGLGPLSRGADAASAFLATAPAADAAGTRAGASPTQAVTPLGDDLQQLLEGGALVTAVVPAAPSSSSVVIQYTEPNLVSPFATVAAAMDDEGDGLMVLPTSTASGLECGAMGPASERVCQPVSVDASAATAVALGTAAATPPLPAGAAAAAGGPAADASSEASTGQFSDGISRDAGMAAATATAHACAAAAAAGAGPGHLSPLHGSSAALYEQSQHQQQQGLVAAPASGPGPSNMVAGVHGVLCKQEAAPSEGAVLVRHPSLPGSQQQQQQAGLAGSMLAAPGGLQLCPGRTDMAAIAAILPAPPGMTNESHMAEVSALLATAFSTATALGSVDLSALVTELVRALDEHITALKCQQEGVQPPPPLLRSGGSFGSGSFASWTGPVQAQAGSEGGSTALHVPFPAPLNGSGIHGDVIPAHAGATGVLERHLAATAAAQGPSWQAPRAALPAPADSVPAGPRGQPSTAGAPNRAAGAQGWVPRGAHMAGATSSGSPVWRHSPVLQPQGSSGTSGPSPGPWMMASGQQQQQQHAPPPHLQHQQQHHQQQQPPPPPPPQQHVMGYQGQPSAAAAGGRLWMGPPHPQSGLNSSGGSGNMAHLVGGHGSVEPHMAPPTVPTPPPYPQAAAAGGGPGVHAFSSGMTQPGAPLQIQGSWGAPTPAMSGWQQQQVGLVAAGQQAQQLGHNVYEGHQEHLNPQGSGLSVASATHARHHHLQQQQQQQHTSAAAGLQGGMSGMVAGQGQPQQRLPAPTPARMPCGGSASGHDSLGQGQGSHSTAAATCAASYHMLMAGHGMAASAAEQFGPGPSSATGAASAPMGGPSSSSMGYHHHMHSRGYDLGPVELPLPLPSGDTYPSSLPMAHQPVGQPVQSTISQFDLPISAPQGHITGSALASFSPADHSAGYHGFDFDHRGYQGGASAGGMGPAHPSNYISSSGAPSGAAHNMGSNWSTTYMGASERATASGSSTTTSTGVFMSSPVFQEHKSGSLGSSHNILSLGPAGWPGSADAAAGMQQQHAGAAKGVLHNHHQAPQQHQQQVQVVPTLPNWADMMGPPPYPHDLLHTGHNSLLGEAAHAVNA